MGVVKIDEKNKLTITYGGRELPFGGIDSSRQSNAISPDSFQTLQNMIPLNGDLVNAQWQQFVSESISISIQAELNTNGTVIQYLPQVKFITDLQIAYTQEVPVPDNVVYVMGYTFTTINNTTRNQYLYFGIFLLYQEYPVYNPFLNLGLIYNQDYSQPVVYKNINGTLYITGIGLGAVLSFTYAGGLTNLNATQDGNSIFCGGVISELNGSLIIANTVSTNTTTSVVTATPYQVAWSAPGNYGQFNPLVGGLITGAGYNNLPDVEDYISGIINSGPTAMIIRQQGMTEMLPGSSGIEPFTFQHVSVSHKGIGANKPGYVSQFGNLGAYLSSLGVTAVSSGSINNNLADRIWQLLNIDIANTAVVELFATVVFLNRETFPAIVVVTTYNYYIYNLNNSAWAMISIPDVTAPFINNLNQYAVTAGNVLDTIKITVPSTSYPVDQFVNLFWHSSFLNGSITINFALFVIASTSLTSIPATAQTDSQGSSLVFPIEDFAENSDCTIDAIVAWIYCSLPTTPDVLIYFFINNTLFNTVTPTLGNNKYVIYPSNGVITVQNIQLSVSIGTGVAPLTGQPSTCVISKITLYGTVDISQRP